MIRVGNLSHIDEAIHFLLWCDEQHAEPSIQAIKTRFGVSRATAYRRLAAWRKWSDMKRAREGGERAAA